MIQERLIFAGELVGLREPGSGFLDSDVKEEALRLYISIKGERNRGKAEDH